MRVIALVALLITFAFAGPAQAGPEEEAAQAAESWLALIDGGRWGESWGETAALFQAAVTEAQWTQQISAVRNPLGAVRSRVKIGAQYSETLPGAPDGRYVVIQYRVSFDGKRDAVETITPAFDRGRWRVAGYYIK
ncbi:MAG: DUF4019 domain-containing protein [Myxococcales bacterium]|nr:DUF4019 domain-containing protein [Myxococcales bacterium]